jgi:polyprenyl-phospho-N-acetylgalactosaminyl synthase
MAVDPKNVWIVIPAFNEEMVIGKVVEGVIRRYRNVVVIDDASADLTSVRAKAAGAHVVRHPINLGQGAALQTGFDFAVNAGASHVVTFDADGQHDIEDVPGMIEALADSRADVALGSRFLGEAIGMSRSRHFLLWAATVFTRLTTGLRLSDCHNGLRALTSQAARKLTLRQNRMAHASEILTEIRTQNLRFVEVPVTIRYTDYSKQKGQRFGDAFVIVRDLLAARLSS